VVGGLSFIRYYSSESGVNLD